MKILRLYFELIDYPYDDTDPGDWAKIDINVVNHDNTIVKNIFHMQWNLSELIDWILENEEAIMKENMPVLLKGNSIARAIYNFRENLSYPEEEGPEQAIFNYKYEVVWNYKVKHGLRFGMRGTDINDTFIGLLNGKHTISLYEDEQYNYEVDLSDFFNSVREANKIWLLKKGNAGN